MKCSSPYCHHEKREDKGCPRRLIGGQILLAARIFAVVTCGTRYAPPHPYRKAWSEEKALHYIRGQVGRRLDPGAVDAFLNLLDTKKSQ